MIIEKIIEEIKDLMDDALNYYEQSAALTAYEISEPPVREFGDFSTNIAFILSKKLKKAPILIANEIIQNILPSNQRWHVRAYLDSAAAQHPGFINFMVKNEVVVKEFIEKAVENDNLVKYSRSFDPTDTYLIEHTSVNPNKALHVGHIRNAIIGDCLFRLFKKVGRNVKVLNYVDDSGLQVADIVVGLKYAGIPMKEPKDSPSDRSKFDHYCGNEVYVKINEMYCSQPELLEKRKSVLKQLEDPKSDTSEYTHKIVMKVLGDQLQTSWNLKCRYDLINFESQIVQSDLWKSIFEDLKEKEIISFEESGVNKGCWVYKSDSVGDKVLVRSDSTLTYFAKDIPYAIWKLGYLENPFDFSFYSSQWDSTNLYATVLKEKQTITDDNTIKQANSQWIDFKSISKVITIIDSRQERLQSLLSEILIKLGIPVTKYEYLGYEPVVLSKGSLEMLGISQDNTKSVHMSGRKGIFIEADRALLMLEQKSLQETVRRNPEISHSEALFISSSIAVSSLRYFFIKFDFGKMITFDINESLSLDGDTAPYIQYAYARGRKVDEKVKGSIITNQVIKSNIEHKIEFTKIENDLIWHLCKYTRTLSQATEKSNPKIIAKYLFQLATLFNNFYDKSPILSEKIDHLVKNRTILLSAALLVLKDCMDLVGITAINKM